jgi:hypothetical protein
LCTKGFLSLSSYTDCVDWRAVCWKQFSLKNGVVTGSASRMDRFVTRKFDGETFGYGIKQNLVRGGQTEARFLKIVVVILFIVCRMK